MSNLQKTQEANFVSSGGLVDYSTVGNQNELYKFLSKSTVCLSDFAKSQGMEYKKAGYCTHIVDLNKNDNTLRGVVYLQYTAKSLSNFMVSQGTFGVDVIYIDNDRPLFRLAFLDSMLDKIKNDPKLGFLKKGVNP